MRTASQLELRIRSWGGRRPRAGRKAAPGRRDVPHRRRAVHDPRCPVHVTLRARPGLPSLRGDVVFAAVRAALAASSTATFRVVHWSIQADHLHLLVEADGQLRLVRGLQGLAVRVARTANRPRASRAILGGPVSCPSPEHAAGSETCPGVRVAELAQAHPRRARTRSTVVGGVVPGVARSDGVPVDEGASGATADVARGGSVAAPRLGRSRRNAGARAAKSSWQGRSAPYQRVGRQNDARRALRCSALR